MPIPPAVLMAIPAIQGLFQGLSQSNTSRMGVREQGRQFDISAAPQLMQGLQMAPLRDRLLSILTARFGANPSTYTQAQAGYQPSAQLGEQEALYKRILDSLGYGQAQPGGSSNSLPNLMNRVQSPFRGKLDRILGR